MAACGSLQHIFDNPLPENATLLESLSPWKQIKNMKPIEDSSFTEIFGELHFKENKREPSSSSSSSSSLEDNGESTDNNQRSKSPISSYYPSSQKKQYKHSDSFSSMNSESLSLCTEGLGFESSDDVEDSVNEKSLDSQQPEEKICSARQVQYENFCKESKRSRTSKGSFPPPISCIGRTGKPWVCFKSYREDGRFILQEIRFPTQEFLHACREDGRLKLQFIQSSDDEFLEGDGEEEEDDDDELENHKDSEDRKIEENDADLIRNSNVQDSSE